MDGSFDLAFFIVGSLFFFVIPFLVIFSVVNWLINKRMAKKGRQKPKHYWFKLIIISILVLIVGLFLYDAYYKLPAYTASII